MLVLFDKVTLLVLIYSISISPFIFYFFDMVSVKLKIIKSTIRLTVG